MSVRPSVVESYMTPEPMTLGPNLEITRATAMLLARRVSGAPVVDASGALVGMLTAKDLFRAVLHAAYHQEPGGVVRDYMSSPVQTLDAGLDIVAAAERFSSSSHRRFPVVKDGRLIGILTRLDLLRAFSAEG